MAERLDRALHVAARLIGGAGAPRAAVALDRCDGAAFFVALARRGAVAFRCWAVLRAAVARFFVEALDPDLRALVERLREDCLFGCGISLSPSV